MRAVFSVDIPFNSKGSFPTNDEFLSKIRAYGWDDMKIKDLPETEKVSKYKELAADLWEHMPEIRIQEKDYVIFYGVFQDNLTKFVITRMTEGQATFRILHPNLVQLIQSTEKLIRRLVREQDGSQSAFQISNQSVIIFERGFDSVFIKGHAVTNAFLETMNTERFNLLLSIMSFLLAVPIFLTLYFISGQNYILTGTLERLTTTLLATLIIGMIGFLQSYTKIRSKVIHWSIETEIE